MPTPPDTPAARCRCRARPSARWPSSWPRASPSASAQRLLAPGARLPSVRDCARRHGVSPSTVVAAYDQLLAQGLVEARRAARLLRARGRGRAARAAARGRRRRGRAAPAPVDATALIRGMFQPPGALPTPGLGTLPADWLDLPLLQRALRRVSRGAARPTLRCATASRPATRGCARRCRTRLADLGMTRQRRADRHHRRRDAGAGHRLAHAAAAGRRGAGRRARLGGRVRAPGARWACALLPVPRGAGRARPGGDGARCSTAHRPRLYVTVSVLHNPTGASLSLRRAHQVLQPGRGARPDDRRGRHLRLAGAAARAAAGRAGRAAAHGLRLGLLEDPGAELARRLHRRAAGAGRAPGRHQAARHADHAGADRAGAGACAWSRACCAAMPSAWWRGWTPRARAPSRWPQSAGCRFVAAAARPVRLGRHRRATPSALAQALLDEGWLIAPGRAVPRHAAADAR